MPRLYLLADLTDVQQNVLCRCLTQGIEPDDGTVNTRTIHTLKAKGLIHIRTSKKGRVSYRATDKGRALVAEPVPKLLAQRSQYGYTHLPHKGMIAEPEAV